MTRQKDKYTYRVTWSEDDQEYIGLCVEFPSLSWLEEESVKALAGIQKLVLETVEDMQGSGEEVPEPYATRNYSGKLMLRITPETHRILVIQAAEHNVSLNRYIASKLF